MRDWISDIITIIPKEEYEKYKEQKKLNRNDWLVLIIGFAGFLFIFLSSVLFNPINPISTFDWQVYGLMNYLAGAWISLAFCYFIIFKYWKEFCFLLKLLGLV
jgi:hypothetical protein